MLYFTLQQKCCKKYLHLFSVYVRRRVMKVAGLILIEEMSYCTKHLVGLRPMSRSRIFRILRRLPASKNNASHPTVRAEQLHVGRQEPCSCIFPFLPTIYSRI